MSSEVVRVRVNPDQPDVEAVARAAEVIRRGGLVAFPTETVYGLGADALNPQAVARIFEAKGRPAHDPIIVHVAGVDELARVAREVPSVAQHLAEIFWPGPLTLVVPKADVVPPVVTAGGETVAVRCPAHPVALALIRASQTPIAAPSANRFGHTSPTTAQHVLDDLAGRFDLLLDSGPTPVGVESTVLDLTAEIPTILRPGGVPREALEAVLGQVAVVERGPGRNMPLRSPGLLERHYAPRAELWLFTGPTEPVVEALCQEVRRAREAGRRVAALVADEDVARVRAKAKDVVVIAVGPSHEGAVVAQRLFAALRTLDAQNPDLILARDFPRQGLGLAVHDRLVRAADRVVDVTVGTGVLPFESD
ncbi:MAG: L-threonylcarbamoyladenylate synthase [Ardenticatenia bacterium]|nr:L-threonylcarbamoyladenylate synthase [Ardenticatenia bacterium]